MTEIFFVRHGENTANITKEFSHKHVDYSLTSKGIEQARQTATFFEPYPLTAIYSSPLKRAFETATIIAQSHHLLVQIDERLREINVGQLEFMPPSIETWNEYFRIASAWRKGDLTKNFPDGENFNQLIKRIKGAFSSILQHHPKGPVIIVGHGGIFGEFIQYAIPDLNALFPQLPPLENCSITHMDVLKENKHLQISILKWGNYAHLTGEAARLVSGTPSEES